MPGPAARSTDGESGSRWLQVTWLAAAAVLAVVVVALAAVQLGDDGPSGSADLSHVHGLAIDPADGTLYAGTHGGLFRVTGDQVEGPVADRVQDFMGFTVVGPEHYVASGHPGADQDGPPHLGLIESTDGGQTWTSRSLSGDADFHALDHGHGTVFGYNAVSGALMVSEDLENWDSRSEVPMADIAVSPETADTVLATTESGLARSDDGGRTFDAVPGAPLLLLVDWADDGTLVGVDPGGAVYVGTDEPSSLEKVGALPGRPEALHVEDADTIYAASEGRLVTSNDGGSTFADLPGA